jgi:hypothetical protein
MKSPFLLVAISSLLFLSLFTPLQGGQIHKTYAKKESVTLKAILGSCNVFKSKDDSIHIEVLYSFSDDEYHAVFSEAQDSLFLEEEFPKKSPIGTSHWIIAVPENTRLYVSSATGNISAEGVQSEMKAETGTGTIDINKSTGTFDLGTGTGNVQGTDIMVLGSSRFTSGTGNVSVALSSSPDKDILVNSGTGSAVLNYQENPLKGFFEFGAIQNKGRIVSPVKFETEDIIPNGNLYNEIKSFRIDGKDEPRITIRTGTGLAKLIK